MMNERCHTECWRKNESRITFAKILMLQHQLWQGSTQLSAERTPETPPLNMHDALGPKTLAN